MVAEKKQAQPNPAYLPAGQAAADAVLRLARLAAEGRAFDWGNVVCDLRDEWSADDLLHIMELGERLERVACEAREQQADLAQTVTA